MAGGRGLGVRDGGGPAAQLVPQAAPQTGAAALLVVLVEALALELARAVVDVQHLVHDLGDATVVDGDAGSLLRGLGLGADLAGQLQVQLILQLQRRCRVASLAASCLDDGRIDALGQHAHRLVEEEADDAGGVETAGVVDDDRGLADLAGEVQGRSQGLVGGLLALDDLHQRHLVDRGEEVDTDEVLRALHAGSQLGDRQGGGVRAQDAVLRHRCLDLCPDLVLELGVLEDRLDDDVTVGEVGVVHGRGDPVQQSLRLLLGGLAALQRLGLQALGVGLALLRCLQLDVLEDDLHAGLRGNVGDGGAHHAGADHAQLLELLTRHVLRAGAPAVAVLQVEEEGLHHVLRGGTGDELHEVAGLDAGGLLDVLQLQTLDGCGEDRLRRRHRRALDLLGDVRREGRQECGQLRVGRGATRDLVALGVPRLLRVWVFLDPLLRGVEQLIGRDDLVDQAGLQRVLGAELTAGGQDLHQRVLQTQHAGHTGHAAATRQQAEGDLRQADLQTLGVGGDAVVGGQSQLEAAAEGGAVDGCRDRHTQGLQGAQVVLHLVDLLGQLGGIRRGGLDHGLDVATGEEGLLRGSDHNTLDLAGLDGLLDLRHGGGEVVLECGVHGVDRRVRVIHRQGEDAIGVDIPREHIVAH